MSFSSTERLSTPEEEGVEEEVLVGRRKATQGRTPSKVLARLVGSSQRCSQRSL
jgi:hypothetical protein